MLRVLAWRELLDHWRSRRLLFVPLGFLLFGAIEPVGLKLLPTLLRQGTNLPPGALIRIPVPTPGAAAGMGLGEIAQMGVLLLVLVTMGQVAGERQAGILSSVFSWPIQRVAYLGAKALALTALVALALALGIAGSVYETMVLFGPVSIPDAFRAWLIDLPYFLLPVAVTLAASAVFRAPLAAGGTALAVTILLDTVPNFFGGLAAKGAPSALLQLAQQVIAGGPAGDAWLPALTSLVLCLIFLLAAAWALERHEV